MKKGKLRTRWKTVCSIDSSGPVRAISEGRVGADRILKTHPLAEQLRRRREVRERLASGRISLEDIPGIVAAGRRRKWLSP